MRAGYSDGSCKTGSAITTEQDETDALNHLTTDR
jgi:hypothetical protein